MNWTKEQKQVIDLRDCDILVSAAAGSGKTAVLVERILSRILDRDNPVNIDEFLVVTFTRAAAAQMKERLQRALEHALEKEPENEQLQRQLMLVPMAQISTIHSFCGMVIQNYFHRTGVEPSYRVGSESELGLVKSDVMQELLEEKYAEASEEFMQMAQMSRFVKSDAEIENIVLALYEKAVSEPFPQKFLERMRAFVCMETVDEWRESSFVKQNETYVRHLLGGMAAEYKTMLEWCQRPGGPVWYQEVLQEEKNRLGEIREAESYEQIGRKLRLFDWKRLPGKKGKDSDEELKEAVKKRRDRIKAAVKSLREELFDREPEEQLAQLGQMRENILAFLDLTQEFMERYRAKKSEKALVDFSDLEQMAMEILVEEEEDGTVRRTDAARELSEQYAEIMIDEYQDSNLVQEMLLGSVAASGSRFMVGDIKQSIYRFRMARPELFLEKMSCYKEAEGAHERLIHLSSNFRSREIVLDGTNAVFEKIMHREFGGVEYDEAARLHTGAVFPQTEHRTADAIDVYAIQGKDDGSCEGKLIAERIKEYTGEENPLYIFENGEYRKVSYGDIVILARSTKAIGQQIYDALTAEGIPVYMENTKGFFDTREISILVNLFHIIDNPRQDIPLAAVMRSPMFDFTDDELAILRGREKEKDFYDSLLYFCGEEPDEEGGQEEYGELRRKTKAFLEMLDGFRDKMTYVTVADLIQDIYRQTHIDSILRTMRGGTQRKANLDMLLEIAREFDRTSYKGLYQFVRYIRGIRKREEDLGEANILGNRQDVVQIMTIHKSKGLEFPVCILAGMGRKLGAAASRSFLVVNPDVGIASHVIDNEKGTSCNNTFYRSLSRMNQMEDMGEELRVLYVAMTRAKEKLVMTGCADKEKSASEVSYFQLLQGKSYYDWVLPAVQEDEKFRIHWVETQELLEAEIHRQADVIVDEVMINNFDTTLTYDEQIRERLAFIESYEEKRPEEIPTKLSVSEIKRRSMQEHEEDGFTVLDVEALENQSPVPKFASGEEAEELVLAGAGYGTVWHQVLASMDFSKGGTEKEIEAELARMVDAGRLRRQELRYIRTDKLLRFFASTLGREMAEAKEAGKLYREQPFVMSVPAREVLPDTDSTQMVLVQGIIDGFYENADGIVLMDYKTDRLKPGQENVLAERYCRQMELYARALEGITGKPVVRKVLYSFSLDREIGV